VVLGDFSTLLAAVPALLGQAHYSREAEREADAHAVKVLKDAGLSPLHMVTLFEALEQERQKKANKAQDKHEGKAAAEDENSASWLGIAFASHPSDADRIAYFRAAAQ
jgi:Zn-dependent protease with chaperone function